MADDGSKQAAEDWSLPKFSFKVQWDSQELNFQEISGLDIEASPIEYRAGDTNPFSVPKMPGLKKYSHVTMKRGVLKADDKFWDWFNEMKMNVIERKTITISLLDEAGSPTMVWKLANAWPTKISGTDLKSQGNEVAVESIVIAHEGITIENK